MGRDTTQLILFGDFVGCLAFMLHPMEEVKLSDISLLSTERMLWRNS